MCRSVAVRRIIASRVRTIGREEEGVADVRNAELAPFTRELVSAVAWRG